MLILILDRRLHLFSSWDNGATVSVELVLLRKEALSGPYRHATRGLMRTYHVSQTV